MESSSGKLTISEGWPTPMILDQESWMNIRRFKQLHATGMTYAEIGRECGCDWRTVRKYLAEDAPTSPPSAPSRKGTQKVAITEVIAALIDAMLRRGTTSTT